MYDAFPADAALTLAKASADDKPGTSLQGSRCKAALKLLWYAAVRIQADPDHADFAESTEDAHDATDEGADKPKKGKRRKKDESGFDVSDPAPLLEALSAHAKGVAKNGGTATGVLLVPPRVLAEYCLSVIREDLGL